MFRLSEMKYVISGGYGQMMFDIYKKKVFTCKKGSV